MANDRPYVRESVGDFTDIIKAQCVFTYILIVSTIQVNLRKLEKNRKREVFIEACLRDLIQFVNQGH